MKNTLFSQIPPLRTQIYAKFTPYELLSPTPNHLRLPQVISAGVETQATSISARLAPIPETRPPSNYVEWPSIRDFDTMLIPRDIFQQQAFLNGYRPGETAILYVAGCEGLRRLSKLCKMPLYKVSSCRDERLQDRLTEIGNDNYGSIIWQNGKYEADVDGWDKWSASILDAKHGPLPGSPVAITKRSISVNLPDSLSHDNFERAYDAAVSHGALGPWIRGEYGQNLCRRHRVSASVFERFTDYRTGPKGGIAAAHEIVVFQLNKDVDKLIAIAEVIILKHLNIIR